MPYFPLEFDGTDVEKIQQEDKTMMHGCTPYGREEETTEAVDWEEYEDWMAELGDRQEDDV